MTPFRRIQSCRSPVAPVAPVARAASVAPVAARLLAALVVAAACAAPADEARAPAGGPVTGGAAVPQAADTSPPAAAAPSPAAGAGAPGAAVDGPADTSGTWTAGVTRVEREPAGVATLRAVRSARNDGFDRIVLDFGTDPLPAYDVEYIDRPIRQCGSGDAVPVAGDGWLRIHAQPARGHTDAGEATVVERNRTLELPVLAALVMTCDFEAHVEWVAGVRSPNRYRVLELRNPTRLVVDIRHGAR
jgi:hypothetical protein